MRQWQGKRYWLVGASAGLGAALAGRMSREGCSLVLSARNEEPLRALAAELPGPVEIVPLDVTDEAAVSEALARIGDIDGVVQLAGVYWPFGGKEWDAPHANLMARVNFGGAMALVGAVLPRFVERRQGHIVLTGSLSGFRGLPGAAPYCATKAGVMVLAESLYSDLRSSPVEIQLVNPGFIRTRLTDKNSFSMPFLMEPEEAAEQVFRHMNTRRFKRSFPRLFSYVFRGGQILPDWLYYRIFA